MANDRQRLCLYGHPLNGAAVGTLLCTNATPPEERPGTLPLAGIKLQQCGQIVLQLATRLCRHIHQFN